MLLRYSILYRYEDTIIDRILPKQSKKSARDSILSVFEWAENADNLKWEGPVFTIIYVKCPHVAFLFDKEGNEVPREHRYDYDDNNYYLDQLFFTTTHLQNMCKTIIEADSESIIVLQSDHGVRHVSNVTMLDQCNILNAVYFKGNPIDEILGKNGLNTWITVLRKQFNLEIPNVEGKGRSQRWSDPKA